MYHQTLTDLQLCIIMDAAALKSLHFRVLRYVYFFGFLDYQFERKMLERKITVGSRYVELKYGFARNSFS